MEATPDKLLSLFLIIAIAGWMFFAFSAKAVALILRKAMGLVVLRFRLASLGCIKNVFVRLKSGGIASVSVGELRLSMRKQGLQRLWDWKLQLSVVDVEVVMANSTSLRHRKSSKKASVKKKKESFSARTMFMIVARLADYINITMSDVVIRAPEDLKLSLEIKDIALDIFKEDSMTLSVGLKVVMVPLTLHMGDKSVVSDEADHGDEVSDEQGHEVVPLSVSTPIFCLQRLVVGSSACHVSELGLSVTRVEVICGDAVVDLEEKNILGLLGSLGRKGKPQSNAHQKVGSEELDSVAANKSSSEVRGAGAKDWERKLPMQMAFDLSVLRVVFRQQETGLVLETRVMGVHLQSKSFPFVGGADGQVAPLDIQCGLGEVYLLRERHNPLLEILKVEIGALVELPIEASDPIKIEFDVKLGGLQWNVFLTTVEQCLRFALSLAKNQQMLKDATVHHPVALKSRNKAKAKPVWVCSLSAPEMGIAVYGADDTRTFQCTSQTAHLFMNAGSGGGLRFHSELGEIQVTSMEAANPAKCLGREDENDCCWLRLSRLEVEWGLAELDPLSADATCQNTLMLVVSCTDCASFLTVGRFETILLCSLDFERSLKQILSERMKSKSERSKGMPRDSSRGLRKVKFLLNGFSFQFFEPYQIHSTDVPDPKKYNFGEPVGEIVITKMHDERVRTARIVAELGTSSKCMIDCQVVARITHFSLCFEKDMGNVDLRLCRGHIQYEELRTDRPPLTMLSATEATFVCTKGSRVAISGADVTCHWAPDVHIFVSQVMLHVKNLLDLRKKIGSQLARKSEKFEVKFVASADRAGMASRGTSAEWSKASSKQPKPKLLFSYGVEGFAFAADIADGVKLDIRVRTLSSEQADSSVLFKNVEARLNNSRVLSTKNLQICRILFDSGPNSQPVEHVGGDVREKSVWEWVVEGTGTRVTLAYGLQLRAIEDAVEDMLRGLKLVLAAQKSMMRPGQQPQSHTSKPKKSGSVSLACIRFLMDDILAEIEDEPLQGWLDEHYRLMLNVVRKRLVREHILEEKCREAEKKKAPKLGSEVEAEGSTSSKGVLLSVGNTAREWESMQREMFKAYHEACRKLVHSPGSGACNHGRQSGFKPSVDRTSLMSIKAATLNVVLTNIPGGRHGMIERIRQLDCVNPGLEVPFSRIYGYHVQIDATSLAVMLRNYTLPLLSADSGKCVGDIICAKQATVFPKQIEQELFIGEWRRLEMLRSVSGSTPPLKMYSELAIELDNGTASYGVGFEPALADVSYALAIAMKKFNLSTHNLADVIPIKRERSLPWWDDMRYYVHGKNSISVNNFQLKSLATTSPYEENDMLCFVSKSMTFRQAEGSVSLYGQDFAVVISQACGTLNQICCRQERAFLRAPVFELVVSMKWECGSGDPLQHYLHALPGELDSREIVYDPFRSYFLALGWSFHFRENYALLSGEDLSSSCGFLKDSLPEVNDIRVGTARKDTFLRIPKDARSLLGLEKLENSCVISVPIMHLSAHDLIWVFKWWNLVYSPPHKLRSFSRWPRFGVARAVRSGNLALDKVLCECLLRVDSTPACIEHVSLVDDDDPADGLTFDTATLKYEIFYSRGYHHQQPERRDPLELVYQGLDIHSLKAKLDRSRASSVSEEALLQAIRKAARVNQLLGLRDVSSDDIFRELGMENASDDGFLLSTDHFKCRRQTPKADPRRLTLWEVGDKDQWNAVGHSDVADSGELSDDEGFDVVIPDNCLRVSLYELKLLWTIHNRDAIWAWVGEISKAFESQKPSPSRQYAQRKKLENAQRRKIEGLMDKELEGTETAVSSDQEVSSVPAKLDHPLPSSQKVEEEKLHFMVNVVRPQFNLHSEDATGRFLLAAASGRVLARSFTVQSGYGIMEEVLRHEDVSLPGTDSRIPWKRREFSVWLKHVQAHVAPCDVDLGAGLQWLPRIPTRTISNRTGPLLERVFMPCSMYFQYTRHKGGTPDWKVKSLKELSFNSTNIIANMTSRQFQVMVDIIGDLLLARLPKPRKNSSAHADEEEEGHDTEEEADEVVPEGVEEIELARIKLEHVERRCRLIFDDIRTIKQQVIVGGPCQGIVQSVDGELQLCTKLLEKLELDFASRCKARRAAKASLRVALQKAAQQRLMEKEKYKTPSAAMSISWAIDKVVWSMLCDGTSFAEAEISNMILNVDRDFNDHGVAFFIMKSFVVRDCLQNGHSSLLSAWNPPSEWGRNCMLRVFAKQGAPKDGHSPLELFEVEVFPLKIHLTEAMYRMMWEYFFPKNDHNSQERQEARRLSAISQLKRGKSAPAAAIEKAADQQVESLTRTGSGGLFDHLSSRSSSGPRVEPSKHQLLRESSSGSGNGEARAPSLERKADELGNEAASNGQLKPHILPAATKVLVQRKQTPSGSFSENGPAKPREREKDGRRSSKDHKSVPQEEKDTPKVQKSRLEFHNIKISQVELIVTYEGFPVGDLRLLMDTFARAEFTGSWRRLFSQVKKHIIWSVLKSVTGMQGRKFKDKLPVQEQAEYSRAVASDSNSSDSGGSNMGDSMLLSWNKRQSDRAGAAFVSSVKGIFNSQRHKAAFYRPPPTDGEDWNEGGSISKAKQLLRRHAKKFRPTIRLHGVPFFGERLQVASSTHASSDMESDGASTVDGENHSEQTEDAKSKD